MAEQAAVAAMIGQRHRAVNALDALATGAARDKTGKAAAVEQHHGLLAAVQTLAQRFDQPARECGLLARFEKFLAHVDELDAREGTFFNALREFEQRIFAAVNVVAALEARSGRSQNHTRAGGLRANNSHIAAIISRGFFLLVALV